MEPLAEAVLVAADPDVDAAWEESESSTQGFVV
jgi:hypothetical protein